MLNNMSLRAARSFVATTLSVAVLWLTLAPLAAAQVQTGSLVVNVRGASGAVVAGASVTLTREGSDATLTAQTNEEGVARFANLPSGNYKVSVAMPQFRQLERSNVLIVPGQMQTLDLNLEVSRTIASEVVVTSAGENVRSETLSAIPNLNGDLTPLLQAVPGAVATGPSTLGKIVIDGKGKDQQTIRLDGSDAAALVELPSGDAALDVFSGFQKPEVAFDLDNSNPTQSRAFAPRFGPGTGAVVDGLSYSASGAWRGQLYGEHRNDAFNARNFFDSDGKDALRRSRFGAKAGGPLGDRDHALLFLAYDGVRGRVEHNVYEAVPADAACNCGSGPVAPLMRGFLPAGTTIVSGASLSPDFLVARRRVRESAEANGLNVRLDFKPLNHVASTLRFTRLEAEDLVPDGVTGRLQRQRAIFNNVLAQVSGEKWGAVHTVRFGVNNTGARATVEVPATTDASLSQSVLTTGGTATVTGLPGQTPTVSVATLGGLSAGIGRGFRLAPTSFNPSYDYTRPTSLMGKDSTLFFGVEARLIRLTFDELGGLTYAFPDISALRAGTPGSVQFLSDLSAAAPFSTKTGPRHAHQNYLLGYFQADSQVRPNLKLTYGLRYDYFGAVRERDDRAVVVDPRTGDILPPGSSFYRASKTNFQPRFGLALSSDEEGLIRNMVFRAGVGIYSGVPRVGDLLLPIQSDRFSTGLTSGVFPTDPSELARNFAEHPETRQFQPLAFARDFTTPERGYKWEASLTRKLNGLYDLKFIYAGNVGRNLPLAGVANQITSVQTNPDPTKPAIAIRQFDIVRDGLVFKPYGEFFYRSSHGRSSYDALTIQLVRNSKNDGTSLPNWLRLADLNVLYTLTRNVGNASGAVASSPLDFNADFGDNAGDARHKFTFSTVYNLWDVLGKDEHRGQSSPIWGWRIAPLLTVRSGFPLVVRIDRPDIVYLDDAGNIFSAPAAGRRAVINTPGGGATAGTRVPNLVAGTNPFLRNGREFLNPQAFTIPAPGTFGNLRRGLLRGPGSVQLDLALTRYLFSRDTVVGDLRVEFFNIFNHTNFNNPTASLPNALGTSAADNQLQPGMPFTRAAAGNFGVITAADPGRTIQVSFVLRFKGGFTK